MDYEVERDRSEGGQPSLTEMTQKAITRMKKAESGFVLMIEGGRIDHGHHANKAKMVLKAVKAALDMTDMVIVTADHGHAISMAGYPDRGNNILGLVKDTETRRSRTRPIGYANGPGFDFHFDRNIGFWKEILEED